LAGRSNQLFDAASQPQGIDYQQNPDLKLRVEGHTDNQGSAAANQALSEKRAQAVVAWLVAHGTNASRLAAKGMGQTMPVADNSTQDGRAKNRRVELVKQ